MSRATLYSLTIIIFIILIIVAAKKILTSSPASEPGEEGSDASSTSSTGDYSYAGSGRPSTKNFSCDEMDCHDGTPVPTKFYGNAQRVMNNLQVFRDEIGLPVFVNSGYRSPAYNASLSGAAKNSYHMRSMAMDIRVAGMTPTQVHARILTLIAAGKMQNGGLGIYKTFVHYDVGPANRRWDKR